VKQIIRRAVCHLFDHIPVRYALGLPPFPAVIVWVEVCACCSGVVSWPETHHKESKK